MIRDMFLLSKDTDSSMNPVNQTITHSQCHLNPTQNGHCPVSESNSPPEETPESKVPVYGNHTDDNIILLISHHFRLHTRNY